MAVVVFIHVLDVAKSMQLIRGGTLEWSHEVFNLSKLSVISTRGLLRMFQLLLWLKQRYLKVGIH